MSVSLSDAQRMIQAGIAQAEKMGVLVAIAVVDAAGYLVASARMDKARLLAPDVAIGKANAAALWKESSAELGKRWGAGAPVPAAAFARTGGRFVAHQGALPIWEGDDVVAAVGVSGARSDEDEGIAQAAIDALKK
jgi:uncharacterized protein GlcG (DUF336 family)